MRTDTMIAQLRDRGFRITAARRAIVEVITKAKEPLSAQDIADALGKQSLATNLSTVYRELNFLVNEGILKSLQFGKAEQQFELIADDHHHHLICTRCEKVDCMEMDDDLHALEKKITKEKGFEPQRHELEFYGVCASCRK